MNRSTPGLPVHHQLPEFTQIHVHRVSDAIQPSHPLSSPSPPAPNLSQHQSLFQWVNSSHEVAKVLEFQLQHHSLQRNPSQISFRMDWLDLLALERPKFEILNIHIGFPGGTSGKEPDCQCRRHKRRGFDPWVGKILWRRKWQSTPVFLSGEFHGQRSLVGYSS